MAIATSAAIALAAAGASAGGSIAAAKMGSSAAKKAAETQAQSAREAQGMAGNVFQQQQRMQQPYMDAGSGAMMTLSRLMGQPAGSRFATPAPPVNLGNLGGAIPNQQGAGGGFPRPLPQDPRMQQGGPPQAFQGGQPFMRNAPQGPPTGYTGGPPMGPQGPGPMGPQGPMAPGPNYQPMNLGQMGRY